MYEALYYSGAGWHVLGKFKTYEDAQTALRRFNAKHIDDCVTEVRYVRPSGWWD